MREPSDSARAAAEILDAVGAQWAYVGAFAALRYRDTPRLTADVDVLVAPVDGVVEAFEQAGYEVTVLADAGEPPHLLLVRGHGDRIDVMLPAVAYQRVALERAINHVITVEDVIIHKLIAWRPRDRNDVLSILDAGHSLDIPYIRRWAEAWEVLDRWEEAQTSR